MANTAPPPTTALPHADFADWLSPMLVKDLRQGVRTRMFVVVFILLQVAMLLGLSLSLLMAAGHLDASGGTAFFWGVVSVPVLLIVPLSGFNAIGSEIKANTLELIFLTHLTAFRIVAGKWFALFTQSLLLVCAVLPYLMLRYFMGGVNITTELLSLGMMLLSSALLTALTTGLSAFPVRLVRPLAVVVGLLLLFSGTGFLFGGVIRGGLGSTPLSWVGVVTALLWGALLIVLSLDVGAARIAPPAENHTGFMRGLVCAGLALAAGLSLLPGAGRFGELAVGPFIVAVAVCAVAVCEQPRAIPSVYRPFTRWGVVGRFVGRFFYPGWPSGVMFTFVMFVAFGMLFWRGRLFTQDGVMLRFLAILGTLLFPTALARTVFRRFNRPGLVFFLTVTASLVVLIFCSVCDNALGTHLCSIVFYLPPAALFAPSETHGDYGSSPEWPVVTILSALTVLIACVPAFRPIRAMERASLDLPNPPKLDTPVLPAAAADPVSHVPLA